MNTLKREPASVALVVFALATSALALFGRQAHGDGLPLPPRAVLPPLGGSQSCLMTTGRREVAYANTEACLLFTRERGVVLPYASPRYYPPPGYGPPPNGENGR